MDFKYISYNESLAVKHKVLRGCLYLKRREKLLKSVGLKPHLGWESYMYCHSEEKSYTIITNEKKWLFAKIKYSII